MPGPDELERMAREQPADPAQERLAAELMGKVEELTGKLAAAHPELAADVFRNDESDLDYFLRRRRETQLSDKPAEPATKKLVFDFKSGELMVAPVDEAVPRERVVLDQIYDDGFFGVEARQRGGKSEKDFESARIWDADAF